MNTNRGDGKQGVMAKNDRMREGKIKEREGK